MRFLFDLVCQFLYPALCGWCRVLVPRSTVFCTSCWSKVKPVVSLHLPITQQQALPVFAGAAYEDPVRLLVTAKFSSRLVASKQLAALVKATVPTDVFKVDYLVPIPLHWSRYAVRGYNQSRVMADYMSKKTGIPVVTGLQRTRRTAYQWLLSRTGRQENLHEAFELSSQGSALFANKRILLVDDLCTTGATLQSAARALRQSKPQSVVAVVGCRAI